MTGPSGSLDAPGHAPHVRSKKGCPPWSDLNSRLDTNADRIAALNASVSLAAGRPPASEELALAAAAREGLAAVVAAFPPSALWGAAGPAPVPAPRRAAATGDLVAGLGLLPFNSCALAPPPKPTVPAAVAVPPSQPPAHPHPRRVRVCVVAGPCGAGKSTVGAALAPRFGSGTPFIDGDDYHSPEAKAGMSAGVALEEGERSAWLGRAGMAAACAASAAPSGRSVLACSALSRTHRRALETAIAAAPPGGAQAAFVMLLPPRPILEARLAARAAHFMAPALLASQLDLVEEGDAGLAAIVRDGGGDVEAVVGAVLAAFGM